MALSSRTPSSKSTTGQNGKKRAASSAPTISLPLGFELEVTNQFIISAIEQFRNNIGPKLKDIVQIIVADDDAMKAVARGIYAMLPFFVRFALAEDRFVAFCLDNRGFIVDMLKDQSQQPHSTKRTPNNCTRHKQHARAKAATASSGSRRK